MKIIYIVREYMELILKRLVLFMRLILKFSHQMSVINVKYQPIVHFVKVLIMMYH